VLSRALTSARQAYEDGERSAIRLRAIAGETIASEPLARLQYISCADALSLQEIDGLLQAPALLSMAVYVGKTRLIDNTILGEELHAAGH